MPSECNSVIADDRDSVGGEWSAIVDRFLINLVFESQIAR